MPLHSRLLERIDGLGKRRWPSEFLWGSATAALQIEGAARADGKGDSIWDAFARIPGAVAHGDTPERAVDHYHRVPADVRLMKDLGLTSYRFSTSWARVVPDGRSTNSRGLDFYSRLVDELLQAGILPWLTLYHWDLPQALEDGGGWAARDTAHRFVDYAEAVHDVVGDRVDHWTTFNEPFCSSLLSYAAGLHAPGRREPRAALAAVHHQHVAHGRAVSALRSRGVEQLGITLNLTTALPADPEDAVDQDAARRFDALANRIFLEPLVRGSYPADFLEDVAPLRFEDLIQDGDLEVISAPLDFLGVNYYHDDVVSGHPVADAQFAAATDRLIASPYVGSEHVTFRGRGLPRTGMDWEIHPDGLRALLLRLTAKYPMLPPLYLTENGAAFDDVLVDGAVQDDERTDFLLDHVAAVADAIDGGADVRGYFVWSLLDNFEWAWGYDKRFGIIHVDYETFERTPKQSALAFAALIEAAGS
ncbi:beta-glucosidase [Microbacterium proteolyticum]|uniref:Beta-glucosidase n=1 Tax=Microbacterium proteolyticum TaxID=1572644 RepID=A0A7W5CJM4_9MICO|nr:GH1 family beta-glucosidase [Microbacterium proteolyticum]MBB3158887.1 beta-glucosidase [Microbacterium proteolyticum]